MAAGSDFTDELSEIELRRLFPDTPFLEIEVDHEEVASDCQGRVWGLNQVFCAGGQSGDRAILAIGEYTRNLAAAYQSLLRILEKTDIANKADLPISWKVVSQYSDMVCSSCGEVKQCMRSGDDWMKAVSSEAFNRGNEMPVRTN